VNQRLGPTGREPERGAGVIGTAAGFLVFLLLMFAAVQILFNLYATSMVTAAAHDAARDVAGFRSSADRCAATIEAGADFAERMGGYGDAGYAHLQWICTDPEIISVRVIASHPSILPRRLLGLLSLSELDRTIEVRIEQAR
jgi:TadE-like protein